MSISAMKQALEALEWNYGTDLENIENCTAWLDKLNATIAALRQAIAEAEKQPHAANSSVWRALFDENQRLRAELKFNTSPPKREWVGLNIEDYAEVKPDNERAFILGARWAEAKLKEKNA